MLAALCAFVLIQPGIPLEGSGDAQAMPVVTHDTLQGSLLMEEVVRVRIGYDHVEHPTTSTVITAFFLSACYFGLERHNYGWFHLREAITLAQILGMQDESTYDAGNSDNAMRRQMFWLLFVSERCRIVYRKSTITKLTTFFRAHAIHKHRPLTLHATIQPPQYGEPGECAETTGLTYQVNLFRVIDDEFSRSWNKGRSDCSASWLMRIQDQLTEALPEDVKCSDIQLADLSVTQQWLRSIVWQLATASGCLSSNSPAIAMNFSYPIDIARDVLSITSRVSRRSMEIHGIGLVSLEAWKMYDVADSSIGRKTFRRCMHPYGCYFLRTN